MTKLALRFDLDSLMVDIDYLIKFVVIVGIIRLITIKQSLRHAFLPFCLLFVILLAFGWGITSFSGVGRGFGAILFRDQLNLEPFANRIAYIILLGLSSVHIVAIFGYIFGKKHISIASGNIARDLTIANLFGKYLVSAVVCAVVVMFAIVKLLAIPTSQFRQFDVLYLTSFAVVLAVYTVFVKLVTFMRFGTCFKTALMVAIYLSSVFGIVAIFLNYNLWIDRLPYTLLSLTAIVNTAAIIALRYKKSKEVEKGVFENNEPRE